MLQWLPESCWASVQALADKVPEAFSGMPADMEGSWKRWKEWFDHEQPEGEPLPQEWKRLPGFQRLLVLRALRPDRMVLALQLWVGETLGNEYRNAIPFNLATSFEDAGPAVPIFFLLSPGVDPLASVRALGKSHQKTEANGLFCKLNPTSKPRSGRTQAA